MHDEIGKQTFDRIAAGRGQMSLAGFWGQSVLNTLVGCGGSVPIDFAGPTVEVNLKIRPQNVRPGMSVTQRAVVLEY